MIEHDETLAVEAQQGNTEAFAALVDRHKGRVYRTLQQMVGNEEDAQDLAQEVFLKFFRSLAGYRREATFTTWLHRITLNLAFDWLRARRRRPVQVPLAPLPDLPAREPESPAEGPEESALRQERQRQLRRAIQALPFDYREVVLLRHVCHLSYLQIAERIGAPVRTVETRLYRARALLRRMLEGEEGGEGSGVHGGPIEAGPVSGPDAAR